MRHSSLFHSGAQSTLDQDAPVVIGPKGDKLQLHAADDEEAKVTCQVGEGNNRRETYGKKLDTCDVELWL